MEGRKSPRIVSMRTTLAGYLDDFLARGDAIAFVHRRGLRREAWSYERTARSAFAFARELEARSIGTGDRVVLWGANSPEWAAAFLGCLVRGAIAVPLDVGSESGFVSRVDAQVGSKLALLDPLTRAKAPALAEAIDLDELDAVVSRRSGDPVAPAPVEADDTFEIVFTSGTTAEPKGVRVTHRNLLANLAPLEREIGRYLRYERFVHPLRFLNLLPLSHIFGQIMGIFVPQLLGGEVFFQASLTPARIIETVKRERISVVVSVPRVLEALREAVEREREAAGDLARFRRRLESARGHHPLVRWWTFRAVHARFGWKFWAFISGGATLSPETEEFWDRLGFAVIQGYGMTETASLISVNHPFKLARGSIGRVMPGQEVKLAPDGEILVRGENVSPGYWGGAGGAGARKPGAKEPGGESGAAADGWLRTGDAGEIDAEGNLYFKGRVKETIVTAAGMKVYPADVEAALDRQPEVKASVVTGVIGPHGPEPVAALILRDAGADAKAAVERANASLAEHQRVRRWIVWPEEDFPRTPTRKVRVGMVAEKLRAALEGVGRGAPPSAAAGASSGVRELVSRIAGEAAGGVDARSSLGADLKLDSLGRVELLGALEERYEVEIDESAFTEATTVGEIERIVHEGSLGEAAPYPFPRWQERWPLRSLRVFFLYLLVLPFTRGLGRPVVRGAERLRDLRGPVVFVCNHVTIVDPALVLIALPGRFRRRLAIAMDGEILRRLRRPSRDLSLPARFACLVEYAAAVLFFNVFSMPRTSGFRRSFAYAGEAMDRGRSILVFPEGRLTPDGKMGPFMPGTGLLLADLRASVVPIRMDGLWELKLAGERSARPGAITITIGEPVRYGPADGPARIAADLEERVREL